MGTFLFVDESGHDGHDSPYEVLAGVAVADRDLWNLLRAVQEAEERIFGRRYSNGLDRELKAKKILNRKTFRLAAQLPPLAPDERRLLAKSALDDGAAAGKRELTALAQAKLDYAREVLEICARFRCRAFASVVQIGAPRPLQGQLRKDYAYLFERFFYFLEAQTALETGIIVFDEQEKSASHLLLGQMSDYFQHTAKGRQRAGLVVPEPFFVHFDLTTGVQLADLVAYLISWGVRFGEMNRPAREELESLATQVRALRFKSRREIAGLGECWIWSFCFLDDLRPRDEQGV